MVNTVEAIGIGVSVVAMALALFLLQVDSNFGDRQPTDEQVATVVVGADDTDNTAFLRAASEATGSAGQFEKLLVDDVVIGIGDSAVAGDTVVVHYIGSLQNGQQFDNSYQKGESFTFTLGEGKVIKGWEQGVIGMQTGGQRILVIPSELGYGENGIGPIPGNATLVFAIELLEIK